MKCPTFAAALLLVGCASMDPADDRKQIVALLEMQRDAWNRGDLDAFLEGYWKSEQTVFAGGDKVHRGFDAMAARYRNSYGSREKMGTLAFTNLNVESLQGDRAVVTGAWDLELADGSRPGGVFTLILRRLPEGWRIVHDHTSSRK